LPPKQRLGARLVAAKLTGWSMFRTFAHASRPLTSPMLRTGPLPLPWRGEDNHDNPPANVGTWSARKP
jgi:hypothetical protein